MNHVRSLSDVHHLRIPHLLRSLPLGLPLERWVHLVSETYYRLYLGRGSDDVNEKYTYHISSLSYEYYIYLTAGNPFDVLKTKMMSSEGKGSPSIVGTAKDLMKHQGIKGFYRGIDSNVMRAMVLNGTKMACYDQTKGYVVQYTGLAKTSLVTQFISAVAAGFFMTCTVSPFDMVRTRLMNQPSDAKIYSNAADCFMKIAKNEGPLTFWRGFMPIWSRFAPTTTIQLIIFEQLRTLMGMKSM